MGEPQWDSPGEQERGIWEEAGFLPHIQSREMCGVNSDRLPPPPCKERLPTHAPSLQQVRPRLGISYSGASWDLPWRLPGTNPPTHTCPHLRTAGWLCDWEEGVGFLVARCPPQSLSQTEGDGPLAKS